MRLTDTRIRNAKPKAKAYKLSDGGGMYLLVNPDGGRYWRFDYRFARKRRTLALGVYPIVTLSGARAGRDEARRLLTQDIDPNAAKKARKRAAKVASENTFEAVAREWIANQRHRLAARYCALLLARLEADVFPHIGSRPIAEVDAPELLDMFRRVEKRGVIETARRLRQICGQVFRYAFRRNTDKGLPATHTVEINFKLPADFPAGGISNPEGVSKQDFKLEFLVDDVAEKAVVVGNAGMSDVDLHTGSLGVTFMEKLGAGAVQTTTIANGGASVHSRHTVKLEGKFFASQSYGQCKLVQ